MVAKYLRYSDEFTNVFWSIEAEGLLINIQYGKFGTKGTVQSKVYESIAACEAEAKLLIDEKLKFGYYESEEVFLIPTAKQGKSIKKINLIENMQEDFGILLTTKNVYGIHSFIDKHAKGNITELRKHLKSQRKYWLDYVDLSSDSFFRFGQSNYGYRADDRQKEILIMLSMAVCDRKEINSIREVSEYLGNMLHNVRLKALMSKTKPIWIEEYLLNQVKRNTWATVDYKLLRYLENESLINFNPELYALNLANYREHHHRKTNARQFLNDLLNDEIALKRDIPLLFEYETVINNNSFYEQNNEKVNVEYKLWHQGILLFVKEHKISRDYVITNALSTQTKEWNNGVKLFFKKIIEDLNLSSDEIVINQQIIFPFLQQTHPPVVNFGLELLKSAFNHSNFRFDEFLEWVGVIFYRDDCKTGIKKIIPSLEKVVKNKPEFSSQIALMFADGFVIQDLDLHQKLAKSIQKIGAINDISLIQKLEEYSHLLMGNVKSELKNFLSENDYHEKFSETYQYRKSIAKKLINPVMLPKSWNEILFQFGNFISNEEMLDGEILMNTFITQRELFPKEFRNEVKSYVNQIQNNFSGNEAKNLVGKFLISKVHHIQKPAVIEKTTYHKLKTTEIIIDLIKKADEKIIKGSNLPLLCLPTHYPYWIEPKELLSRIILYKSANEPINMVDFSVALSRMPRENIEDAIPLLPKLDNETKHLIEFCFGLKEEILFSSTSILEKIKSFIKPENISVENISLWAMAATTFYPTSSFEKLVQSSFGNIPFWGKPYLSPLKFTIEKNEWKDYRTQKMESNQWLEMTITNPPYKKVPISFIYGLDVFNFGSDHWSFSFHDKGSVYFWESLMPQNIEALANKILITNCKLAEGSKNSLFGFLDVVVRCNFQLHYYGMNLFACCFFMENKEVRIKASEVLYQGIAQENIDLEKFGLYLANLINENYGVFTRFIESLLMLRDTTAIHNSGLIILFDSIFANLTLNNKLPTNFKKMLEFYYDLLNKTEIKISVSTQKYMNTLIENPSLKKLIGQIVS